jgi:DNA-binding HxlR family transcriptional regulator
MRWADYDTAACSVGRALEVLGDRWTLLVLRDVFNGVHRFDELLRHLGVSRDVLTRRLADLVADGILERRDYREPGQRTRASYHLTQSGKELQPVLVALLRWGEAYRPHPDGSASHLVHAGCGGSVGVTLTCSEGHEVERRDVRNEPGPGARLLSTG